MRTSNPILRESVFEQASRDVQADAMTVKGAINKAAMLLLICIGAAGYTWNLSRGLSPADAMPWILGGAIGGLVLALVTTFAPSWSPVTAPIYAMLEGFFIGGISAAYQKAYGGIVLQAGLLTFGVLFVMLTCYRTGLIRVTDTFRAGVVAATGGIFFFYLAAMLLSFFGVQMPLIHSNGLFGIGFSVAVVALAAFNLVLDFDLIDRGAEAGAPKYMEWYGGFALLVTLVWLYIEILRLLAKLQSRRD